MIQLVTQRKYSSEKERKLTDIFRQQFVRQSWRPCQASPGPKPPSRAPCQSPARDPTALTSISSTLMSPHTRHSSGDTRGATPSTTGRSTSHRRTTHLRPRYDIDIETLLHTFLVFQLKWNDGYAGHGEHYFDYNHGDSYKPARKVLIEYFSKLHVYI